MTDCVSCGALVPAVSNHVIQPHCLTDECNLGYAKWAYWQDVVPDGDCLIWKGYCRKGCPIVRVTLRRSGPGQRRWETPARGVALLIEGVEPERRRKFYNTCGNALCVAAEHTTMSNWEPPQLSGHLDIAPLLKWVDLKKLENPDDPIPDRFRWLITKAVSRGFITVRRVDEICCDWLGMHPADIYGDEFYTA